MLYYALGAAQGGEYYDVKMTIIQPRLFKDPIKSWTVPIARLEEYAEELKAGVAKVDSGKDHYKTGNHCQFCRAKPGCPKQKEEAQAIANIDFASHIETEVPMPDAKDLTEQEIVNILNHQDRIESWMKSVRTHATTKMKVGAKLDGYKLVRKITHKKLVSVDELELMYGDKGIYKKAALKSIKDIESIVGKEELAPYIIKPEGEIVMVSSSDRRKEVLPQVLQDFSEQIINTEEDFNLLEF